MESQSRPKTAFDAARERNKAVTPEKAIDARRKVISSLKSGRSSSRPTFASFKRTIKKLFPTCIISTLKDVWGRFPGGGLPGDRELLLAFNDFIENGTTANAIARESIRDAVESNRQTIIFNKGPTGLGKSTVAQQQAIWIDEARDRSTVFHIDIENADDKMQHGTSKTITNAYITYSYSEAIESLTELTNEGDTTIMDEFQPPRGVGSVKQKDNLVVVMESCTRAAMKNFIINTPREHELPEVSLVFEVIGINVENRKTLAIMTIPKKEGVNVKRFLGIVVFDIEMSDDFLAWYRVQSKLIKKMIEENGGAAGAGGLSEKKLDKYSKLLLDKLNAIQVGKYKDFILDKHINVLVQQISMIAVLDQKSIKEVVEYAFYKKDDTNVKQVDDESNTMAEMVPLADVVEKERAIAFPGELFTFDLERALKKHANKEQVKVFRDFLDSPFPEKLAGKWNRTGKGIEMMVKSVEGTVKREMGHTYEPWLANKYRRELADKITEVKEEGEKGQSYPDIEIFYTNGDVDVISVKCEHTARRTIGKDPDDFRPELKEAARLAKQRPDKKIRCILHYYNDKYKKSVERELDHVHLFKKCAIRRLDNDVLEVQITT